LAGKFIGIGVGPGDPELVTVKAVTALKMVDVVSVPKAHADTPSMALGIVKHILEEREKPPEVLELVFPMTKRQGGCFHHVRRPHVLQHVHLSFSKPEPRISRS